MNRRQFNRTTIGAFLSAALGWIPGVKSAEKGTWLIAVDPCGTGGKFCISIYQHDGIYKHDGTVRLYEGTVAADKAHRNGELP